MVTWLSVSLLKPFRALRYDPERAGTLDRLVAPPHDVVTPELHKTLLAASPYNAVRLVKPEAPEEAARDLMEWRNGGVLLREEQPAAWILEEEFVGPDGVERSRRGLVVRTRVLPYSDGRVLPHERTFTSAAMVDGQQAGVGTGPSKKAAEQAAAKQALAELNGV